MKKFAAVLSILVAVTILATLVNVLPAQSQPPVASEFQIVIDNTSHAKYGLYYPVTYEFTLPAGSSGLTAQYRYSTTDAWTSLPTRTSADFFNGIDAVRFDYPNNTAFVSVHFSNISDVIYVRLLDASQQEVGIAYSSMPLYYDDRKSAATVSLDDWDWAAPSQILTADHIHYTIAIWSNFHPDWPTIQYWYNQGYLEPGGHTRDHPCNSTDYLADGGYDYEIAGVRDDILANLTLRHPYVPAFITPCGFEDTGVRAAIVKANYIADRGAAWGGAAYTAWGGDGAYLASNFTYSTFDWAGTQTAARRDAANAAFDTTHTDGGIYHLTDHPADGYWVAGSYLAQHIDYISNRLDVWYASYGELYLYHYVQERGKVTISPVGAPLPTFTPTFTPTTAPEVTNPTDISTLANGTNVLFNFNNFPNPVTGAPVPANYGGMTWNALVEGPAWAGITTWNIYIPTGQPQGTITFPRPVLMKSLLVSSGLTTTITLSSSQNPDSSITLAPNVPQTVSTGWVYPITYLIIKSSTSDQALDDLRFTVAGAVPPTATATQTPLPTATATFTPTSTPKKTPTPTATRTPTLAPTKTFTATATATPTALPTSTSTLSATPTNTPLPTATNTPAPTATNTPLPTSTSTPVATATSTSLPTATSTPLPTATFTPFPTATNTPLPTPTNTPLPTATSTPVATATSTSLPTATNTPLPTATFTPLPTATNTLLPTATFTPLPTATNTPLPTATFTPLPTATFTPLPTATDTPQPTATNTPLATATFTPLPTATFTPLPTATFTPLPTATNTPLPTATFTPLPTATNTPLPTATFTPLPTATFTPLPTATNTPRPTSTNTPLPTATFTPTVTNTPLPDLIFADGFESGSLAQWSSSVTNSGGLSVTSAAAMGGIYGMQSQIANNNPQYIQDDTPNAEPHYRARFYFNPNSITMNNNNYHSIFIGYQGAATAVVRIDFRKSSSSYQLRAGLVDNASTWQNTGWDNITNAAHYVELDWSAATASGTANGSLTFWIDGVQQAALTGVANDTRRVDMVRLGSVTGIDSGTRGTYYLDSFISRRSTYIGP